MNDKYKLHIMFISKSTHNIFQQYATETDPLLNRIQENDVNDNYYYCMSVLLITITFVLIIAVGIVLFVL